MKVILFILIIAPILSCNPKKERSKSDTALNNVAVKSKSLKLNSREILDNPLIEDKGRDISRFLILNVENSNSQEFNNVLYEAYHKSVKKENYHIECLEDDSYHNRYKLWCLYYEFSRLLRSEDYERALLLLDKYLPSLKDEMNDWFKSNFVTARKFIVETDSITDLEIPNSIKDFKLALKFKEICNTSFYQSELRQNYEIFEEKLKKYLINYPNSSLVDRVEWILTQQYAHEWEDGGIDFLNSVINRYQDFIEKHPSSIYISNAKNEIVRIREFIIKNELLT